MQVERFNALVDAATLHVADKPGSGPLDPKARGNAELHGKLVDYLCHADRRRDPRTGTSPWLHLPGAGCSQAERQRRMCGKHGVIGQCQSGVHLSPLYCAAAPCASISYLCDQLAHPAGLQGPLRRELAQQLRAAAAPPSKRAVSVRMFCTACMS